MTQISGNWKENQWRNRYIVDIMDSNGYDSCYECSFRKKRREDGAPDKRRIQGSSFYRKSSTTEYIRLGLYLNIALN